MVLVVSGLDPSAGAGLFQDVKVLTTLGVKINGVASSFTVQNERKVFDVSFREIDEIEREINVLEKPKIIKIGLAKPEVVELLRQKFQDAKIVWNVVLESSSEYKFLDEAEVKSHIKYADFVVLNSLEAQKIGDFENFIITGGHDEGTMVRVRYKGKVFTEKRVSGSFHGTGCAFSSALAGFLDYDYPPEEAISAAMKLLKRVLVRSKNSVETEKLSRDWIRNDVLETLNDVLPEFLEIGYLTVPEVGQNISYALPWAKTEFDVGKFPGRIRLKGNEAVAVSCASFKGKSHTARMTIEMMKYFPYMRCAVNVRYEKKYVENAMKNGLKIFHHDRSREPEKIRKIEGESMKWMIKRAVESLKEPPEIIYDEGWIGKEAMMRVFGRDPWEVLEKIKRIIGVI